MIEIIETTTGDGRTIDVVRGGAKRGPALVLHHGTPSDATVWTGWDDVALEHGLQLLAISRPGYAGSSRLAGRRVVDAIGDVATMLARIDAPWCVTVGWSGGGPHALATAAVLGERCRSVATLAGVAPYGVAGLDFLAGMGPENVAEFGAALAGEPTLRAWMNEHGAVFRTVSGSEIVDAFGGLVPDVDRRELVGGFAEAMAAEMRRALGAGFDGWIDDDFAFTQPWGFDLAEIAVPATIWQGDLDLMVPHAHGRWLAENIPGAKLSFVPGHGHISLFTRYQREVVERLLAPSAAIPD